MTQIAPSSLLTDQALVQVQKIIEDYRAGAISSFDEFDRRIKTAWGDFIKGAGEPVAHYDPLADGEPPSSEKWNLFLRNVGFDINILNRQSDFLRASINGLYNATVTEIEKSKKEQAKLRSQVNVMQMYGENYNPNVFVFKEEFGSDTFFDYDFMPAGNVPFLLVNSFISLGKSDEVINLSNEASVEILASSNGFLGNNQELKQVNAAPESLDNQSGVGMFVFVGDELPAANPESMLDGDPTTWFEYEHYRINPTYQMSVGGLGFTYMDQTTGKEVAWADGPSDGKLRLDLKLDLGKVVKSNSLTISPYGLAGNVNYPVQVEDVAVSSNGTDWFTVQPSKQVVTTNQSLISTYGYSDVIVGSCMWSFGEREIQFVKLSITQKTPVRTLVGHTYYKNRRTGKRVKGSIPDLANPRLNRNPDGLIQGELLQRTEYFNGQRYAIGIRGIDIQQNVYQEESFMVSERIHFPNPVREVAIDADVYVPEIFDSKESWVNFFISPNDGVNWYQLSRITDDYLAIPEILVFNDPTPEDLRNGNLTYVDLKEPVTHLRVKVLITRPSDQSSSTPLVRNYTLKAKLA